MSLTASSQLGSVRRQIRYWRALRVAAAVLVAANAVTFAWNLAIGSLFAILPAVLVIATVLTACLETGKLRRLRREEARLLPEVHPRPYLAPAVALVAGTGVTMAEFGAGMARLGAALGSCAHANAVPVDLLVTGERVAWVCPDCKADLPAEWAPAQRRYTTWAEDGERFCPWCPDEGCRQTCARRGGAT